MKMFLQALRILQSPDLEPPLVLLLKHFRELEHRARSGTWRDCGWLFFFPFLLERRVCFHPELSCQSGGTVRSGVEICWTKPQSRRGKLSGARPSHSAAQRETKHTDHRLQIHAPYARVQHVRTERRAAAFDGLGSFLKLSIKHVELSWWTVTDIENRNLTPTL